MSRFADTVTREVTSWEGVAARCLSWLHGKLSKAA